MGRIRQLIGIVLIGALTSGCVSAIESPKVSTAQNNAELASTVSLELTTFESDAELRAYAERVERLRLRHRKWSGLTQYAQLDAAQAPCPPHEDCPTAKADEGVQSVIVTGSTAAPAPSITNNQTVGVDEGDIVKQIGPFLLVLQDGRIFSVDTREGLTLADRANVYQDPDRDIWYDEMLVQDDRVIVAGYSYASEGAELTVLRLDRETGRLSHEGVFVITSDDYYDVDNYATRIVGDRLVIYTPYELDVFLERDTRPVIRRWLPSDEREGRMDEGRPLLDARHIYRPLQPTWKPTVHTISVCPLGPAGAGLQCRTTGFTGPRGAEMYVSPRDVFLWVWPGWADREEDTECKASRAQRGEVLPSAVFRLSISDGDADVIGVSGVPFDQFSMDSRDGEFRGLAAWIPSNCYLPDDAAIEVSLLKAPFNLFGTSFVQVRDGRLTPLPSPGVRTVENRFTEGWLVYGGRHDWSIQPPDDEDRSPEVTITAVPLGRPNQPVVLPLRHNIGRLELVGPTSVFLDGYRDDSGLDITILKLAETPAITSAVHLTGRFESEGRSHAFNSSVAADGQAVMGVPTVGGEEESDGWWWRSDSSDVSFLTLTPGGQLAAAGELLVGKGEADAAYECEVSCIDWYGNSRPIFTGGRIFALMGTEIVEGRLEAGHIRELRRLDLTATPATGLPR